MPADPFWLTTRRLGLRRFTAADLDWVVALYSDAQVMQYLGGPKDRTVVTHLFNRRILGYYDRHPGLGIWMTIDRQAGTPIGLHNLNHIDGEPLLQVGFILARSAWGRGYASEMARALLRYGFSDLSLPHLAGMTDLDNLNSQRVLEKIGLRRNGIRSFPAYASAGPQAWFERDAASWLTEHKEG